MEFLLFIAVLTLIGIFSRLGDIRDTLDILNDKIPAE